METAKVFKYALLNSIGTCFNEKYVVIQSDDWGSIRMPSNATRERLSRVDGLITDDAYSHFDTLCSPEDIDSLYGVLRKFRDKAGRHPIITANAVMANPDFDAIRANNYEKYHKESLRETYTRYRIESALDMWLEGSREGLMDFQFHGREHVNVPLWMNALRGGLEAVRTAAEHEVFGVSFENIKSHSQNFQAAWDYNKTEERTDIINIIKEGLVEFKNFFNHESLSVIAPSYTWCDEIEDVLMSFGVYDMQGIMFQFQPRIDQKEFNRRWRWTKKGGKNNLGYQCRNVFFEPALNGHKDQVGQVLLRIEQAFRMRKPAIIGSHRINFAGGLSIKNRESNLKQLHEILENIIKRWPDVRFVGSSDLAQIKNRR